MVAILPIGNVVDISKLKVHPKNAEIYGEEDVSALAQSIAESGWIRPLTVTPDYVIISGHRRYQAAKQLGYTQLPIEIETFASEEAEMERLLRENENRGKTPEQQIREGMTWQPIEEAKSKRRQGYERSYGNISITENGAVRDIIARRIGLGSGKTYEKGKEVVEYIDKKLAIGDLLQHGELLRITLNEQSISAASNLLDKIRQSDAKAKKEQERKEAERQRQQELARQRYLEAVKKAEHCTLYHCSVADLSQYVQPDCIDCIITDPPYPKEFLPVYSDLAQFASYALKPGGSLVVMTGQSYIQEVIERLASTGLTYQWMCAYLTPGGQSPQLWERKVNTFWKPVLWFVKGDYTGEWIGDVCKSEVNHNDKSKHKWGQSESGMADIIERFTKTDQLICDPFAGGGGTAIAAMEMHRRFVGCDIDERYVVEMEEIKASLVAKEKMEEATDDR
jgi:uncharacterized protein YnzC (UPF0291/DUF896 family)